MTKQRHFQRIRTRRIDATWTSRYFFHMISLHQVLDELPSLSREERRLLSLRLLEMDCTTAEAEDLAACEHSASLGFALMD
jgi:hypothetical protein